MKCPDNTTFTQLYVFRDSCLSLYGTDEFPINNTRDYDNDENDYSSTESRLTRVSMCGRTGCRPTYRLEFLGYWRRFVFNGRKGVWKRNVEECLEFLEEL